MRRHLRRSITGLISAAVLLASSVAQSGASAHTASGDGVRPIRWSSFDRTPRDPASLRIRDILRNSDKFTLTTWWESRGYSGQSGEYLDPLGPGGVTAASYHAFGLAVSLATKAYDASHTGVTRGEAQDRTLRMVRTVARRHAANTEGGWGNGWQDPSFAAYAGWAGWLLWDELAPVDREYVRKMVEYSANGLRHYQVAYYRDRSGQIVRPGNSATDENAWRSAVLQLATAMMPGHESWDMWMDKNLEFMLSVTARPEDVDETHTVVNGKSLSEWLNGSNIESNGTTINHSRIHPDYMTSFKLNFMAAAAYTLAGQSTPKAAFHNADLIYDAFVDVEFSSPPYRAPGGTIYVDGSDAIYYPQGTDWSPTRRMVFAETDVQINAFGLDHRVSQKAAYWEALHASAALAQQQRHPDGRMYAPGEHTSEGLDNAVAPARAYLTKWITAQGHVRVTNQSYPQNRAEVTVELAPQEAYLPRGGQHSIEVTATVKNSGPRAATHTDLDLEFVGDEPDGLHVRQKSGPRGTVIPPGRSATWTWTITADAGATEGMYQLRATANYRSPARWMSMSGPINLGVGTYVIPDTDPRVQYTGGWVAVSGAGYAGGGLMSGRTERPSVTIRFDGTRAEYVALTSQFNGYGDVYVDGVLKETIDFYTSATLYQQTVYDTGQLGPGAHTITVVASDRDHEQARYPYINFDALVVHLS